MNIKPNLECECKNKFFKKVVNIRKKPKLEINYGIKNYNRNIFQCLQCKHVVNDHKFNIKNLYSGIYVQKNYQSITGVINNFNRIINLPKSKSDNKNRVLRIVDFIELNKLQNLNILDIGSGLGVFPYLLKKSFKNITCIEKDKILIKHLREKLMLKTVSDIKYLKKSYNFITINKVLEHVPNVIFFLKLVISKLKNKGYLYLEVPDYIAYKLSFIEREEFFIEHYNVFSELSFLKILNKFNLNLISMNRIKEPSGKRTLYAFCQK